MVGGKAGCTLCQRRRKRSEIFLCNHFVFFFFITISPSTIVEFGSLPYHHPLPEEEETFQFTPISFCFALCFDHQSIIHQSQQIYYMRRRCQQAGNCHLDSQMCHLRMRICPLPCLFYHSQLNCHHLSQINSNSSICRGIHHHYQVMD